MTLPTPTAPELTPAAREQVYRRNFGYFLASVGLQRHAISETKDPGRYFQRNPNPLRTILHVPGARGISDVVSTDELGKPDM